jgi:hypothetical protein
LAGTAEAAAIGSAFAISDYVWTATVLDLILKAGSENNENQVSAQEKQDRIKINYVVVETNDPRHGIIVYLSSAKLTNELSQILASVKPL